MIAVGDHIDRKNKITQHTYVVAEGKREMESHNEEWKESWSSDCLDTLAAFSNTLGGIMIIGKRDTGEVIGVPNPKKLLESIPNTIKNKLKFIPDVRIISIDGRECIEIRIAKQPELVDLDGRYFLRSGSTTQLVTGPELRRLMLFNSGLSWTDRITNEFSEKDVSQETLDYIVKEGVRVKRIPADVPADLDSIVAHFDLRKDGGMTSAGGILLHNKPERVIMGSYIRIGLFREDNNDVIGEDIIKGPVALQPNKAMDILYTKYIRSRFVYEGIRRMDKYEYPETALREALINAVSHKDYSAQIPVDIMVYPSKIEIFNPGQLPIGWSVDDLKKKHQSHPPNRRIADVFYGMGLIEKWGKGIERILEACREAGNRPPTYTADSIHGVRVTFEAYRFTDGAKFDTSTLTENEMKVYNLISKGEFTTVPNVAEILGITDRTVYRAISSLKDKGIITRIGSDKNGTWILSN